MKNGRYVVVLNSAYVKSSSAGNKMIVVSMTTLIDRDNKEYTETFKSYLMLNDKRKVAEFLKCFGYCIDKITDFKQLQDRIGIIVYSDNFTNYLNTLEAAENAGLDIKALL